MTTWKLQGGLHKLFRIRILLHVVCLIAFLEYAPCQHLPRESFSRTADVLVRGVSVVAAKL